MGTIVERQRKDGSTGFTAQILLKRGGKVVHREAQTFDRKPAAKAWLRRREAELALPGALDKARVDDPPLAAVIDRFLAELEREPGRTKAQVLRAIKAHPIAEMPCSAIGSDDIVAFARGLKVQPQTRANYLSHLSAIFTIAKPAWRYPLDKAEMDSAIVVARKLRLTAGSSQRDRRPTLDELDRILEHYTDRKRRVPQSLAMVPIVLFAIFSTRRLAEISRITWADLDEAGSRVMVRDMKNPGETIGNHVWCDLTPEALRVTRSIDRADAAEIFPFNEDSIGANWTRAMETLGIEDLHFHDLRHEGISRAFEMGWNIPRVAGMSGHRSWTSLKRYTHLRQVGDKYAGWPWLEKVSGASASKHPFEAR
jgi:integrase